jgi:putative ABC transport system substrate-binding protein
MHLGALVLALFVLAQPLAAEAQQAAKVFRIGILGHFPPTEPEVSRLWEGFLQGLRELGYVEGQNIVIERRYSEGRFERLPALAAELVGLRVDLILATATPGAVAAKQATSTIPIVMTHHSDPVGTGLVASLAKPGGNITGLSLLSPEIAVKRLDLLKQVVPKISRVAVLSNPANQSHPLTLKEIEVAARSLKVRLQVLEAQEPMDLAGAFSAAERESAGALIVLADAMFFGHRTLIAERAAKGRLPMIGVERGYATAGGLLAYGADLRENFRRAALYVDKILKGAKPADLPVEQPMRFELVINLKTAKTLGLTIPQSVLFRADQVIQ